MIYIDLRRARRALARARKTQPEGFIYNTLDPGTPCSYVPMTGVKDNRSKTGCLVGTGLASIGIETPLMQRMHDRIIYQRMPPEVNITRTARIYLDIAQTWQDSGSTWDKAYEMAEKWVADGRPYRYSDYVKVNDAVAAA